MRLWPWRKRDDGDKDAARDAYQAAQETLESAHHEVVLPLRELREVNHVAARLDALITQRADTRGHRRGNGDAGSAH